MFRFRFSLRLLLVLMLVAGGVIPFIWQWDSNRKKDRYVEEIKKRGTVVVYAWQATTSFNECLMFSVGKREALGTKPTGLQHLLHGDGSVVYVFSELSSAAHLNQIDRLRGELKYVVISNANDFDCRVLAKLHHLEFLSLQSSNVTDLGPVRNLTKLKDLDLFGTKVESLEPLSRLQNLERLSLMETKVADVSPLANLHQLKILRLDFTEVTDISPLKNMKALEQVGLNGTWVDDLTPLYGLKNLKAVEVHFKFLAATSEIERLKKARPDVKFSLR